MKKLGFVIPWYGKNIPGGAEMELRSLTEKLVLKGIDLEILTTCVKEFGADWNVNYYKEGIEVINGVTVRRFKVTPKKRELFQIINGKLMKNSRITIYEEETFLEEMINSDDLIKYIKECQDEYEKYIFIPYMFGTTYFGVMQCPEKAVLIPCFHDEAYAYMKHFRKLYSKVSGMLFNAKPEEDFAKRVYNLENVKCLTLGIGMDTDIKGDEARFRKTFNIYTPYLLYAGRKDKGKNIYTLIRYFEMYKKTNKNSLKLVLIGGGNVEIPDTIKNDVIDLGFVETQQKFDAYSGALVLCQPSLNESFSLVIMESWLCGRPVLVHSECEVTRNFVEEANGGLYFGEYMEFAACINYFIQHKIEANVMAANGGKYVREMFHWNKIIDDFLGFFSDI